MSQENSFTSHQRVSWRSNVRFRGRLYRSGRHWTIEVPVLNVSVRSPTKKDAHNLLVETIQALWDGEEFSLTIYSGHGDSFEIGSENVAALSSLLLRGQRGKGGLSLTEVAKRLGGTSPNTYARYERGSTTPSVQKFFRLLEAVAPDRYFVLIEGHAPEE